MIFFSHTFSQNIVPNASFEDTVTCPTSTNQTNKAAGWNIDINTSDYYNSCASFNSMVSVPTSGVGYQCPANGNGYCGFIAFRKIQPNYREYLGRQILPLIVGKK